MDLMLLSANSIHPQISLWKGKPSVLTTVFAIMVWHYWITQATTITLRLLVSGEQEEVKVSNCKV